MVMRNSLGKAIVRTSNRGSVDFDVFGQRERTLLHKLEERFDNSAVLRVSSQFPRSRSFHHPHTVLLSSRHYPMRTSAQRKRPWSSLISDCPPLCHRAVLVARATSRVQRPRDSLTLPHSSDKTPALASGTGAQISDHRTHSRRVAWRLEEEPVCRVICAYFIGLRGGSCVTSFCTRKD